MRVKQFSWLFTFMMLSVIITSCEKEIGPSESNQTFYFKKYGGLTADYNFFTIPSSDGGIIVIGGSSGDTKHMRLDKMDGHGTELSTQLNGTLKDFFARKLTLPNGDHLITSWVGGDVFRISPNGKNLGHFEYVESYQPVYVFSDPILGNDDSIYVGFGNGYGAGSSSNYLAVWGKDADTLGNLYNVPNSGLGFKALSFYPYRVELDADGEYTYWITGTCYPKSNWSWSDPIKVFFAKIGPDAEYSFKVLDPSSVEDRFVLSQTLNSDRTLTCVLSPGFFFFQGGENRNDLMEVINTDENNNVVWRTPIRFEQALNVNPTYIESTSDGGTVVCGYCTPLSSSYFQSFIMKLSATGTVQWRRIYDFGGSGLMYHVRETPEGYMATGSVAGFGKGKENDDHFILMTDRNGNYRD